MSSYVAGVFRIPSGILTSSNNNGQALYDQLLGIAASVSPAALHPAALPHLPATAGFTEAQLYDTYSPFVALHGNQAAKQALADGNQVIIALRMSTNTRVNRGRGEYDDRMAIVWKEKDKVTGNQTVPGVKHGADFTANTQPSAQYEALEKRKTDKIIRLKNGRYKHTRVLVATDIIGPDGKSVIHKKDEGNDVNHSGRLALGRLAEGTYRFFNNGTNFLGAAYLKPRDPQNMQRDVTHDGLFTNADSWTVGNGNLMIDTGDFGVYIHKGGASNTWSAACQTLPPEEHKRFFKTLKAQTDYYYVLVNLA